MLTEMCAIQAGVAMGLAKTVAVRFPEWGPDFATLMVSVAAILPCLAAIFRRLFMSASACAAIMTYNMQV